jgi:hypothetical protein
MVSKSRDELPVLEGECRDRRDRNERRTKWLIGILIVVLCGIFSSIGVSMKTLGKTEIIEKILVQQYRPSEPVKDKSTEAPQDDNCVIARKE